MKKTKKLVALLVALVLVFAVGFTMLAACKPDDTPVGGTYDITVWVSESAGVKEQFEGQIKKFNETNEWGYTINATVQGQTEADSASLVITDVATAPDMYCFAQDQTTRLVQANALAPLGKAAAAEVREKNDGGAVGAATVGETLYAYPLTSDNGYFMMYDKSVINEEHLDDLAALVADCEAAGKKFSMEIDTSGWYLASFFFATGCKSEWKYDDDGKPIEVADDFNSAKGLVAAKGIKILTNSSSFVSSSTTGDFAQGSAIVVSGTWGVNDALAALGDNLGMTDLPSFTVDGKTYHMGSFSGNKLLGVKPQSNAEKSAALSRLALYLTNAENQLARFKEFNWGPSNKEAQANEAVSSNPALAALNKQNEYAIAQGNIEGSWWDIATTLGKSIEEATDDAGLQAALAAYEAALAAVIEMAHVEFDTTVPWGVIGVGGDWNTDIEMEQTDNFTWITKEAIALTSSDEFKLRRDGGWAVNLGLGGVLDGPNMTLEGLGLEEGSYKIQVVLKVENGELVSGTITLIPA